MQKWKITYLPPFRTTTKPIGEWIQIGNRQGEPMEKVVALPVKDPFHIIRNFAAPDH